MKLWQQLCDNWSKLVFKERYKDITPKIRAFRALEEMLELAQAEDVTEEEVLIIVRQVYDKPKGEPHQELGGVVTCLAAYSATSGLDLEECFFKEYMRICDPVVMEKVRKRNLEGDKIGFNKKIDTCRILPTIVPKQLADPASLSWDVSATREGWFLRTGLSRMEPVIGPSICVSSGGGPIRALHQVVDYYKENIRVRIHVPHHTRISGENCSECLELANQWNKLIDTSDVKEPIPQKIYLGSEIPQPHGFDVMGHEWEGPLPQNQHQADDWIPIEEFKNEEHGPYAEVLVEHQITSGFYEFNRQWGWVDIDGRSIIPTHFKKLHPDITVRDNIAVNLSKVIEEKG